MKNFEIVERGNRLLDEATCWVGNEGFTPEDALTETALKYDDLGAIVAALLAGGYLDEEGIFEAITDGFRNRLDDDYDRW